LASVFAASAFGASALASVLAAVPAAPPVVAAVPVAAAAAALDFSLSLLKLTLAKIYSILFYEFKKAVASDMATLKITLLGSTLGFNTTPGGKVLAKSPIR